MDTALEAEVAPLFYWVGEHWPFWIPSNAEIYLDVEPGGFMLPSEIQIGVRAARDAGYRPGIYTRRNIWEPLGLDMSELPLWEAGFQDLPPRPFIPFGGWIKRIMLQYAQNRTVAGIFCDVNLRDVVHGV